MADLASIIKKPIIKIENLSVFYNKDKSNEVRSLDNVSVEIFPQEYVIIYGPSGCGKSTLLYSIAGLQRPTSGSVVVSEQDLGSLSKKMLVEYHRKRIGMIFQAFYLIPSLKVIDNVWLPKLFDSHESDQSRDSAIKLLQRFNIAEQAEKFPSELSGGQKQRVSIARSLINNPEIILADEPVGNLDSKSSFNVMSILNELNIKDKKTILLVTHDPSHLQYGDRIIYMKDGKVIKVEVRQRRKELLLTPPSEGTLESYIFKDGKIKEELIKQGLVKEEMLSGDLRLLLKAFKNLSPDQLGHLLIPFKVQQLFSFLFTNMTDEQVEAAKKKLQDLMYGRIGQVELLEELDKEQKHGGAGWDKRTASDFAERAIKLIDLSNSIDFTNLVATTNKMCEYFTQSMSLHMLAEGHRKLAEIIGDRLKNRIGIGEVMKLLDLPAAKGGLALDKRIAQKIARELELLLLLRY